MSRAGYMIVCTSNTGLLMHTSADGYILCVNQCPTHSQLHELGTYAAVKSHTTEHTEARAVTPQLGGHPGLLPVGPAGR